MMCVVIEVTTLLAITRVSSGLKENHIQLIHDLSCIGAMNAKQAL